MADDRSVQIGGQPHRVYRFKTYKAVLVGRIVARVTDQVRGLFTEAAAFQAEYREQNKTQIDRQLARQRVADNRAAAETAEALAKKASEDDERDRHEAESRLFRSRADAYERLLEDMGDKQAIELPQDPEIGEIALAVFPKAFVMHKELSELLALIVMPDTDLLDKWREDDVHRFLQDRGAKLLEESEPEEIAELAEVAYEVIGDQLRPLIAALRNLWEKGLEEEETPQEETEATVTTIPTSSPTTSSIDSQGDTDGTPSESSSGSPSAEPSPTPAA